MPEIFAPISCLLLVKFASIIPVQILESFISKIPSVSSLFPIPFSGPKSFIYFLQCFLYLFLDFFKEFIYFLQFFVHVFLDFLHSFPLSGPLLPLYFVLKFFCCVSAMLNYLGPAMVRQLGHSGVIY